METQIFLAKQRRYLRSNTEVINSVQPRVIINLEASTLRELFKKCLRGMADKLKNKIYNPKRHSDCTMKINIDAINSKVLLRKFLDEVLELTHKHHTIFCTMYIEELTEYKLKAQLFGNWFKEFDNKIKCVYENGILINNEMNILNPYNSTVIFRCEE